MDNNIDIQIMRASTSLLLRPVTHLYDIIKN